MQLSVDFYNVIVVFHEISKLIMKKRLILEKYRLFERIIPQNGFKFPAIQGIRKNIPVDQPDTFTGFFLGEILTLKGQNVCI